jgi:hypothetical protein
MLTRSNAEKVAPHYYEHGRPNPQIHFLDSRTTPLHCPATVNPDIFAALKVGEIGRLGIHVRSIPHLL